MPAITRGINIIARCGNKYRSEHLKQLGLTAAQAPYVLHICGKPGLSQEDLARALHVNPSNAARQLALLETAGFISREPSKHDKRLLIACPTEKALAAYPEIRRVNASWQQYLTQDMGEPEKDVLERLLNQVCDRAVCWSKQEDTHEAD